MIALVFSYSMQLAKFIF
jgi:hypothetical protein